MAEEPERAVSVPVSSGRSGEGQEWGLRAGDSSGLREQNAFLTPERVRMAALARYSDPCYGWEEGC